MTMSLTESTHLRRFLQDPVGFSWRAFQKTVVLPFKYGASEDYDAAKYWSDRFRKYGESILGPGDEGLSEEENLLAYRRSADRLKELLHKHCVDLSGARVLEIGLGNGYYTRQLAEWGARRYVGFDITDVQFESLASAIPHFQFVKGDIGAGSPPGTFDLILMIDVIQHIVNPANLESAMRHVRECLSDGGLFILSPVEEQDRKKLFYVTSWSFDTLTSLFPSDTVVERIPFRDSSLIVLRRVRTAASGPAPPNAVTAGR